MVAEKGLVGDGAFAMSATTLEGVAASNLLVSGAGAEDFEKNERLDAVRSTGDSSSVTLAVLGSGSGGVRPRAKDHRKNAGLDAEGWAGDGAAGGGEVGAAVEGAGGAGERGVVETVNARVDVSNVPKAPALVHSIISFMVAAIAPLQNASSGKIEKGSSTVIPISSIPRRKKDITNVLGTTTQ